MRQYLSFRGPVFAQRLENLAFSSIIKAWKNEGNAYKYRDDKETHNTTNPVIRLARK